MFDYKSEPYKRQRGISDRKIETKNGSAAKALRTYYEKDQDLTIVETIFTPYGPIFQNYATWRTTDACMPLRRPCILHRQVVVYPPLKRAPSLREAFRFSSS
jgi:hypothetical protein